MKFDDINEATLRLRRGQKWNLYPADVLPAWVADMDFMVAEPIRAAIEERVSLGDLGYSMPIVKTGMPELFAERVAERFGWRISPGDVVILSDVVQGLYIALETLCAPGDGVVIQTPIYPPFLHAAKELERRAVCCPLVAGQTRYEIDFDALEAAIDPGTRILALCHPHNPTGRAFERDELERIAQVACRHDLVVVSDEIHADLMLVERRHIPFATLGPEVAARTVTLMSANKTFNIAGLGMAFAHFGSADLKTRFARLPPHIRGGNNVLAHAAMRAAWGQSQSWLDAVLKQLRTNRDRVAQWCSERGRAVKYLPGEATYLAWLDMRALGLPGTPHEFFLKHARVALSEGRTFGPEGEGFARLNFATSAELLEEVLARMADAMTRV